MSELTSFRSIIELWPKRELLAAELGVGASTVSKWWQRGRVPPEWWSAILATTPAQSAGVTADKLAELAAREREVA